MQLVVNWAWCAQTTKDWSRECFGYENGVKGTNLCHAFPACHYLFPKCPPWSRTSPPHTRWLLKAIQLFSFLRVCPHTKLSCVVGVGATFQTTKPQRLSGRNETLQPGIRSPRPRHLDLLEELCSSILSDFKHKSPVPDEGLCLLASTFPDPLPAGTFLHVPHLHFMVYVQFSSNFTYTTKTIFPQFL